MPSTKFLWHFQFLRYREFLKMLHFETPRIFVICHIIEMVNQHCYSVFQLNAVALIVFVTFSPFSIHKPKFFVSKFIFTHQEETCWIFSRKFSVSTWYIRIPGHSIAINPIRVIAISSINIETRRASGTLFEMSSPLNFNRPECEIKAGRQS